MLPSMKQRGFGRVVLMFARQPRRQQERHVCQRSEDADPCRYRVAVWCVFLAVCGHDNWRGDRGMHADAATVEALAQALAEAGNDEERNRLARALAAVEDPSLAAGVLRIALSPRLPPTIAYLMINGVARAHPDQVWAFAVANREALLGNADAVERNRMFADIVGGSVQVRHADMMENYVAKNFGQDAQVEARRVGDGIRVRAAQKARLLPQVRAALAPQQSPETITRKP